MGDKIPTRIFIATHAGQLIGDWETEPDERGGDVEYIRLTDVKKDTFALFLEVCFAALVPGASETVSVQVADLLKLHDLLNGQQGAEGVGDG